MPRLVLPHTDQGSWPVSFCWNNLTPVFCFLMLLSSYEFMGFELHLIKLKHLKASMTWIFSKSSMSFQSPPGVVFHHWGLLALILEGNWPTQKHTSRLWMWLVNFSKGNNNISQYILTSYQTDLMWLLYVISLNFVVQWTMIVSWTRPCFMDMSSFRRVLRYASTEPCLVGGLIGCFTILGIPSWPPEKQRWSFHSMK